MKADLRKKTLCLLAILLILGILALLGPSIKHVPLPQYYNKVFRALGGAGTAMMDFALLDGIQLEMGEHDRNSSFLKIKSIDIGYWRSMSRGEFFVLSCDVHSERKQLYIGMRGGRMENARTRADLVRLTQNGNIEGVKNIHGDPYDGGPLFMIRYEGTYEGDL